MSHRSSRVSTSPGLDAEAQTGLRLQQPPQRLSALQFEHDRLLKKIGLKKKELGALERAVDEATQRLAGAQPIQREALEIDGNLHRLFAELLARKRQPKATRRMVASVYVMLREAGILSFADPDDEPFDFSSSDAGPSKGRHHPFPSDAGGFSARRPSDAPQDQSLRGLFRRLALAIHPDRVHDEEEKVRRTELMKELSRAYEARDLARLIHLERAWATEGQVGGAERDELGRRCADLERTNAALRTQLETVRHELKDLRRSPGAELAKDLRRAARDGDPDPVAGLIAAARDELERAREVRDFVVAFRDGRMTLAEFARGPASLRDRAAAGGGRRNQVRRDSDEGEEDYIRMFFEEVAAQAPPRSRGRRRRSATGANRSGRAGRSSDASVP